jgi:hypothetical protein
MQNQWLLPILYDPIRKIKQALIMAKEQKNYLFKI